MRYFVFMKVAFDECSADEEHHHHLVLCNYEQQF